MLDTKCPMRFFLQFPARLSSIIIFVQAIQLCKSSIILALTSFQTPLTLFLLQLCIFTNETNTMYVKTQPKCHMMGLSSLYKMVNPS